MATATRRKRAKRGPRKSDTLGRRLPEKEWGRKEFWQLSHIEGRRRKRTAAALAQIDRVADEMVKWGYDVELKQVEDQIPTLRISDRWGYRATAKMNFRPDVPEVGDHEEWLAQVAPQAADVWLDVYQLGEWLDRVRLMGRRLHEALRKEVNWR